MYFVIFTHTVVRIVQYGWGGSFLIEKDDVAADDVDVELRASHLAA